MGWGPFVLHACLRAHSPSALCPGPEPVAKLQRAPAAAPCHEVSPDRHVSTSGPEHHQVSLSSLEISLGAPVPTHPSSPGLVPGSRCGDVSDAREAVGPPALVVPLADWSAGDHPLITLACRKARGEAKKCRKVYGIEHRDQWCTACRWKKACQRFLD